MYRHQRCFVVEMQGIRSLAVAPCAIACSLGVASPTAARARTAAEPLLAWRR
jgi:hypothetical protein